MKELVEQLVSLNDAQNAAVAHESGPLLVVAGAGTGKTRVIVEKINLLLDGGVDPSSILAVTFTEKAAAEMLDRLLSSRSELLADMPITTFNGFGESLLREFGSHIGIGRNFRLLNEQAQIVLVREHIDDFKLDYFLPLTNLPDSIIDDILNVFSQLKQHLVKPANYMEYSKSLPKSDQAEQLAKTQHIELGRAYETYIKLCRQENVIDYDDQIYLVTELLEKRPNIRKILQNRYHSMFIDEFQDTNPMQSRLVDMLVNDNQNLMVVGDDDQSIYGFRGATLANILEFKSRYPRTKEIALTENYRSGQAVLDAAYTLITHNNPHRLEHTLNISKQLTGKEKGQAPQLKRFINPQDELAWITEDIAARIKLGDLPGSIAILARRRHTASLIHEALESADIAHQLIGYSQDLYKQPIVRMLIELCRTLAEPHNNNSLHHTLISDLFGISNELIAPMAVKARHEHELLEDTLTAAEDTHILEAIALIKNLREEAASLSAGRLLWKTIIESGYKDRLFASAAENDEAGVSAGVLSQYFDTLRAYESIANQPTVVNYLVSLPALQSAGEKTDDGTMAISKEEVSVLTVHKAKGLEWDSVYIPDVTEFSFPLKNTPKGLRMPEELKTAYVSPADEHYAEERRLMYVAVTRAKKNLIMTFADKGASGTSRKPSRFLNEMFRSDIIKNLDHTDVAGKQQSLPVNPELISAKVTVPSEIFDGQKVHLSVSQAATLLDCPLDFYYKFVLNAPQDPSARSDYGSTLHNLFERINRTRQQGKLPALEQYLEDLRLMWVKSGYASKGQQERAFAQAIKTLRNFYDQTASSPPALYVEETFNVELLPENIILRGRYDAVFETDETGVEIRDYKTSISVNTPEKAKSRATSSSQLTMYALAWQLTHKELPAFVSLHFVDTGIIGSVKKTQRGIDGLRSRLLDAVEEIKAGKFELGRKHDYCIHP